jgi:CelD/BcsL family acetyltransferase involved in cellulose biosynthesis/RimJ/RimL family protein N-acetyltransferase
MESGSSDGNWEEPLRAVFGNEKQAPALGIVLHRNVPDDVALREQWNSLVLQVERPEVFYTYQWAVAVQCAYGEEQVPWTLLRYDDGRLTGIAALAVEAETRRATFLAGTTADYCDLLSAPADREAWLHAVLEALHGSGIEEIVLPNLPADSATTGVLRTAAHKMGYQIFLRDAYLCAQVELGSDRERQELKNTLQKRKIIRRGLNFLHRQGRLTVTHRTCWNEIEPVLHEFSVAHVARFLATGRLSNLANRRRRVFISELARGLSEPGWLVLSQMALDGRPVASNYGFQFQGSWFWYQPTFDMTYKHISPGYCLLSAIIVEACDRPELRVVDLGLGAEGYKERVANGTRRTVQAFLTTSRRRLVAVSTRYFAGQAAKRSPYVERKIRAGLAGWQSVRKRLGRRGLAGGAAWGAHRLAAFVSGRDEVVFYKRRPGHGNTAGESPDTPFAPLTWKALAEAAMRFEQDEETRNYVLRAANRMDRNEVQGFVLSGRDGLPLHFCWATRMQSFYMAELRVKLSAPTAEDWLIFDCWTPPSLRGRGYYGTAASMAAAYLESAGRRALIFSAASNQSSIRALEKAGFVRDFRLLSQKFLFARRLSRVPCGSDVVAEVLVGPQPRL